MNYIEALEKRYSVKKFDKLKKVSKEILDKILRASQLSASSLGLQPYRILVVESDEMKQKLIPAFRNPSQVSTCSHLLVLIAKKEIDEHYVDGYFRHIAEVRNLEIQQLDGFRASIDTFLNSYTESALEQWAEKQAYIVLGTMMMAAAIEQVDTCPMEGFIAPLLSDILKIDTKKENATVTLALGYRDAEDAYQYLKKVRKSKEKLFDIL